MAFFGCPSTLSLQTLSVIMPESLWVLTAICNLSIMKAWYKMFLWSVHYLTFVCDEDPLPLAAPPLSFGVFLYQLSIWLTWEILMSWTSLEMSRYTSCLKLNSQILYTLKISMLVSAISVIFPLPRPQLMNMFEFGFRNLSKMPEICLCPICKLCRIIKINFFHLRKQ